MTRRYPLILTLAIFCLAGTGSALAQSAATAATPAPLSADKDVSVETLVFIRHGEKPDDDKGQLNCKGLNRALALPDMLINKYGKPDFIFAAGTTKRTDKSGVQYSYIRPLMTIEPTAVRLDLPVETRFAYDDISSLQEELAETAYRRATVFITWEHHLLYEMVKHFMVSLGGDPHQVPDWPANDFDSIYVLHVRTDHNKRSITFDHEQEGLNGLPDTCPGPAPH